MHRLKLAAFPFPLQLRPVSPRPAQQIVSMGETYDFEFVPEQAGKLRLEVRQTGPEGRLLVRGPMRVE